MLFFRMTWFLILHRELRFDNWHCRGMQQGSLQSRVLSQGNWQLSPRRRYAFCCLNIIYKLLDHLKDMKSLVFFIVSAKCFLGVDLSILDFFMLDTLSSITLGSFYENTEY